MPEEPNSLISLSEAASLSGYSAEHIRRLCVAGKLSAQKIGKSWVVSPSSVLEFVNGQKDLPPTLPEIVGTSLAGYTKLQKIAFTLVSLLVFTPIVANLSQFSLQNRVNDWVKTYLTSQGLLSTQGGQVLGLSKPNNEGSPQVIIQKQQIIMASSAISHDELVSSIREVLSDEPVRLTLQGPQGIPGAPGPSGVFTLAHIPNSGSVFGTTSPTAPPGSTVGTIGSATFLSSKDFQTELLTVSRDASIQGNLTLQGSLSLTGDASITGDTLLVEADTTFDGDLTVNGTTTLNGLSITNNTLTSNAQATFTKVPTLPHIFAPSWPDGVSNGADGTVYINPASSVADGNLLSAAVNGTIKFLVDAEGDVYANNLVLTGSTSAGSTNIAGNLIVQDNTQFGDASTDTVTYVGRVASNILPATNNTYDLGSTANKFKDLYLAGALNAGSFNKVTITPPATGATLTIADGKTLTVINTLTFTGTDSSSINFGTGGTVVYTTRTINGKDLSSNITLGLASADFANQGTTTTLLHGNASGNPSFGAVVSADLNITTTTCTNQVVRAISSSAVGTCITVTSAYVDSSIGLTGSTLAQFAATSSAQLAGVISDETGSSSGVLVFNNAPTITSPIITNIAPGADFTITQNSVTPFVSENTGAVVNTLYLKQGNVGVGTTGPGALLHLAGTQVATSGMRVENRLQPAAGSAAQTAYIAGTIDKAGSGIHAGFWNLNVEQLAITANAGSTLTNAANLHISAAPTGATNNYALYIDSGTSYLGTGNVGIGTTNPTQKLGIMSESNTAMAGSIGFRSPSISTTLDIFGLRTDTSGNFNIDYKTGGSDFTALTILRASGNVGIGTTNPSLYSMKLDVDMAGSNGFRIFDSGIGDGVEIIPGYVDNSYSRIISYDRAANNYQGLLFGTTSAENTLFLNNNGQVGIGTTSVTGNLDVVSTSGTASLIVKSTISAGAQITLDDTTANDVFLTSDSGDFNIWTGGNNRRLTVLTTGNVGIGTTVPGAKLEVAGSSLVSGTGYVQFTNTGVSSPTSGTGLEFYGTGYNSGAGIASYTRGSFATNPLTFDASKFIFSNGNVGIGTTSPQNKLDVAGTIVSSAPESDTILDGSATQTGFTLLGAAGYWGMRSATNHSFNLDVYNANTEKTALTVLQNGKVGIGTTNPASPLTINANGGGILIENAAGTNVIDLGTALTLFGIGTDNDAVWYASSAQTYVGSHWTPATTNTYNLGEAGRNWGCLYYNNSTLGSCASDQRLKHNIEDLNFENPLDQVANLRLRKYAFNSDTTSSEYHGLIAQEAIQYAPELVNMGSDGFYKVSYGDIQWLTFAAVQQLATGLDVLSIDDGDKIVYKKDADLDNHALFNVKSIASLSGKWSINENGTLVVEKIQTKEICFDDICLNKDLVRSLLEQSGLLGNQGGAPSGESGGDQTPPPDDGGVVSGDEETPPSDEGSGEETPPGDEGSGEQPPGDGGETPTP